MSKTDMHNQHLVNALPYPEQVVETKHDAGTDFIWVADNQVTFNIQSGPVAENGRNGCDATDIIRYAIGLYRSFNNAHPCRENSCTITKLEEALHWQEARTRDRVARGVEGKSED